jgi:hypothetical protein
LDDVLRVRRHPYARGYHSAERRFSCDWSTIVDMQQGITSVVLCEVFPDDRVLVTGSPGVNEGNVGGCRGHSHDEKHAAQQLWTQPTHRKPPTRSLLRAWSVALHAGRVERSQVVKGRAARKRGKRRKGGNHAPHRHTNVQYPSPTPYTRWPRSPAKLAGVREDGGAKYDLAAHIDTSPHITHGHTTHTHAA